MLAGIGCGAFTLNSSSRLEGLAMQERTIELDLCERLSVRGMDRFTLRFVFLFVLLFTAGGVFLHGQVTPLQLEDVQLEEYATADRMARLAIRVSGGSPPYRIFVNECYKMHPGGVAGASVQVTFDVPSHQEADIVYTVSVRDSKGTVLEREVTVPLHKTATERITLSNEKDAGCYSDKGIGGFQFDVAPNPGFDVNYSYRLITYRDGIEVTVKEGTYKGQSVRVDELNRGTYFLLVRGAGDGLISRLVQISGSPRLSMSILDKKRVSGPTASDGLIRLKLVFPDLPKEPPVPLDLAGAPIYPEFCLGQGLKAEGCNKSAASSPYEVTLTGLEGKAYGDARVEYGANACLANFPELAPYLNFSYNGLRVYDLRQPGCKADNEKKIVFSVEFIGGIKPESLRITNERGTELFGDPISVSEAERAAGRKENIEVDADKINTTFKFKLAPVVNGKTLTDLSSQVVDWAFHEPVRVLTTSKPVVISPSCRGEQNGSFKLIFPLTNVNHDRFKSRKFTVTINDAGGTKLKEVPGQGFGELLITDLGAGVYTYSITDEEGCPGEAHSEDAKVEVPDPEPYRLLYRLVENTVGSEQFPVCGSNEVGVMVKEIAGVSARATGVKVKLAWGSTRSMEKSVTINGGQVTGGDFSGIPVGERIKATVTAVMPEGNCATDDEFFIPSIEPLRPIRCHGEKGSHLEVEVAKDQATQVLLKSGADYRLHDQFEQLPGGDVSIHSGYRRFSWTMSQDDPVIENIQYVLAWKRVKEADLPNLSPISNLSVGCRFVVPALEELKVNGPAAPVGSCGQAKKDALVLTVEGGSPFDDSSCPYWVGSTAELDVAGIKLEDLTSYPTSGTAREGTGAPVTYKNAATVDTRGGAVYHVIDGYGCHKEVSLADWVAPAHSVDLSYVGPTCAKEDKLKTVGVTGISTQGQLNVNVGDVPAGSSQFKVIFKPFGTPSVTLPEKSFTLASGALSIPEDVHYPWSTFSGSVVPLTVVDVSNGCSVEREVEVKNPDRIVENDANVAISLGDYEGLWCSSDGSGGYAHIEVSGFGNTSNLGRVDIYPDPYVTGDPLGHKEYEAGAISVVVSRKEAEKRWAPGKYLIWLHAIHNENCILEYAYEATGVDALELEVSAPLTVHSCWQADGSIAEVAAGGVKLKGGQPFTDGEGPSGGYYRYYLGPGDAYEPGELLEGQAGVGAPILAGSKLGKGQLTLHVKDGVGCTKSFPLVKGGAALPADLSFTFSKVDPLCSSDSTGVIYVRPGEMSGIIYVVDEKGLLPPKSGPEDHGVFSGLPSGRYQVVKEARNTQLNDGSSCKHSEEVELVNPAPIRITFPHNAALACPGDYQENYKAEVEGPNDISLYRWSWAKDNGDTEYYYTESGVLPRAYAQKYTLAVYDALGCMAEESVEIAGVAPYSLALTTKRASCRGLEMPSGTVSVGGFTITGVSGGASNGANAQLVWNSDNTHGLAKGADLTLNREYSVPSGHYTMLIREGDCEDVQEVVVPFDGSNSLSFSFHESMPSTVCYGSVYEGIRLQDGAKGVLDPSSVRSVEMKAVVNYGAGAGESSSYPLACQTGCNGVWTSGRPVTSPTMFVASVASDRCLDTAAFLVRPYDRDRLVFLPEASHVGVIHYGETEDATASVGNYRVMKDSLVLGLLSDSPVELSFRMGDGALGARRVNFAPEVFYTDLGSMRYMLQLPQGADRDEQYESVRREMDGREYVFLRTRAIIENDNNQCTSNLDIWIRVVESLRIPNVFTPNGDGKNDRWLHNGDPAYTNLFSRLQEILPDIEVEVYTRGGLLVWKARGAEVAEGWDGRARWGGQELPVGTYYYVMKFNVSGSGSAWKPVAGSVTIIR